MGGLVTLLVVVLEVTGAEGIIIQEYQMECAYTGERENMDDAFFFVFSRDKILYHWKILH